MFSVFVRKIPATLLKFCKEDEIKIDSEYVINKVLDLAEK